MVIHKCVYVVGFAWLLVTNSMAIYEVFSFPCVDHRAPQFFESPGAHAAVIREETSSVTRDVKHGVTNGFSVVPLMQETESENYCRSCRKAS